MPVADLSWQNKMIALIKAKLPLDWTCLIYDGSTWELALGYSGNSGRLERIESDLQQIMGTQIIFNEETEPRDHPILRLGQKRHGGFVSHFRNFYGLSKESVHLIVHSTSKSILDNFPFATIMAQKWMMMVFPESGKCHLFGDHPRQNQTDKTFKIFLEEELPKHGVVEFIRDFSEVEHAIKKGNSTLPYFEIHKSIKRWLDPLGLFYTPYFMG
jgi:hypothetical protein